MESSVVEGVDDDAELDAHSALTSSPFSSICASGSGRLAGSGTAQCMHEVHRAPSVAVAARLLSSGWQVTVLHGSRSANW